MKKSSSTVQKKRIPASTNDDIPIEGFFNTIVFFLFMFMLYLALYLLVQ